MTVYLKTPSTNWMAESDPELLAICERVRKRAVKQSGDPTLEGWCGICSVTLAVAFLRAGHDSTVVMGEHYGDNHCWVEADGMYYDLTASQFGEDEIVVDYPPEEDEDYDRWRPQFRLEVVSEITLPEFFEGWAEKQMPTMMMIDRLVDQ